MCNVHQRPVIAGIAITTDVEERFNLNAPHHASAGEKRNGPTNWLAPASTHQLI